MAVPNKYIAKNNQTPEHNHEQTVTGDDSYIKKAHRKSHQRPAERRSKFNAACDLAITKNRWTKYRLTCRLTYTKVYLPTMFHLIVNFALGLVRYGLCGPNLAGKGTDAEGKANHTRLMSLTSLLNFIQCVLYVKRKLYCARS